MANPNHPRKGDIIAVDPIRGVKDQVLHIAHS